MPKTFKIFTAISFTVMAIVLTFVGVWALTDLDFSVGGDITYTAPKTEETKGYTITLQVVEGDYSTVQYASYTEDSGLGERKTMTSAIMVLENWTTQMVIFGGSLQYQGVSSAVKDIGTNIPFEINEDATILIYGLRPL